MNHFPENAHFKYSWRKYQQRILDNLDSHLQNQHLHIVAPPGSGKTILGLEVMLRLNAPTVIFSPSITIRNQWVQKFCSLFLQADEVPEWISMDIHNPAFMTVVTYQALHCAANRKKVDDDEEEENEEESNIEENATAASMEEVVSILSKMNVKTLILDEAHHLKKEWWKTLMALKTQLEVKTIALTATPPYDVTPVEWQRYLELNGTLDAEIFVPELVRERDLCPHQDLLYLSVPTQEESQFILKFMERATSNVEALLHDETLISAMEQHPFYKNPEESLDALYGSMEFFSSLLIFLNAVGRPITKEYLELVGTKLLYIPPFDFHWAEILLKEYLKGTDGYWEPFNSHREALANRLTLQGLMSKGEVRFSYHYKIEGKLNSSLSKLESVAKIVETESSAMGEKLRMVVLSDYIRKEFLVNKEVNDLPLIKMGVMPIFEILRRRYGGRLRLGVLSGSLVIIPTKSYSLLENLLREVNEDVSQISSQPLAYDSDYSLITFGGKLSQEAVHWVTMLFSRGGMEVVVGTKSLLGEGWDAPFVNSLILATVVGSYVLSNQMRGRAIRSSKNDLEKTSNIWHLACVEPSMMDGGYDMELMERRFKSFVGLSIDGGDYLQNGVQRLGLPNSFHDINIADFNKKMLSHANKRDLLLNRWNSAIQKGSAFVEMMQVPKPKKENLSRVKRFLVKNIFLNMVYTLLSSIAVFVGNIYEFVAGMLKYGIQFGTLNMVLWIVGLLGLLGTLYFGRRVGKTISFSMRYRDISKDMKPIAQALFECMVDNCFFEMPKEKMRISVVRDSDGTVNCALIGGTAQDEKIYVKALSEIVSDIENPRYVIVRKYKKYISVMLPKSHFVQRDYHAVPEVIGQNKKYAQSFYAYWKRYVGDCEMFYTRTPQGRKQLLSARFESFAFQSKDELEMFDEWV